MPLTDKSANTASSSAPRKRPLDDFLQPVTAGQLAGSSKSSPSANKSRSAGSDKENTPFKKSLATSSPPAKSPGLTESGSSPLDRESPTPNTPSKHSSSVSDNVTSTTDKTAACEPAKKKRATAAEMKQRKEEAEKAKAAKAEELEKKKREKEDADKAKAAKAEELDKKKREKEEAERKKRLEKEEAEKLKAAKAEEREKKRREKEAEKEEKEKKKREKEEEAAKKARSQLTLTSMFGKPISTPKKTEPAAKSDAFQSEASRKTPSKDKDAPKSLYDQMFKPFFVKDHVKLAPNPYEMDDETREIKTRALEEFIDGKRTLEVDRFDPLDALQMPFKPKRGCAYPSVKKIMDEFTGESQTSQAHHVRELLKTVPVKSLKFYQDVRPPYIGTISGLPPGVKSLTKVSRNPFSRDVLPLAYDYDSEAEWQDEEGEDVDELDDEEEEADGEEDMDDFLDDADDTGPSRMVFSGGMEPESTGLCWENRKRLPSELKMCKYRMEFIHEKLEHHHNIDPFSTAYWECPKTKPEPATALSTASAATSVAQTTGTKGGSVRSISNPMPPPSAAADAFSALSGQPKPKKSQTLLPVEYQEKLKDLVRAKPTLSKVGVIELFVAEHPSLVKGQVKNSFDALIVKNGKEHKVKGE
ncbi:chromatin assembly factor 1 subunit rlf2 [Cladorrhinum sp. PSN332]|nr:chromatin assembly factor 1 subunit rlf2 [Cladorrhinum sp. PSN332]